MAIASYLIIIIVVLVVALLLLALLALGIIGVISIVAIIRKRKAKQDPEPIHVEGIVEPDTPGQTWAEGDQNPNVHIERVN